TAWPLGFMAGGIWLAIAFLTRMSSMGALWAAGVIPLIALYRGYTNVAYMCAFLAIVIYIRHGENIKRILKGTESKIGQKK
ncbi:MAG: glycerol-3-phosphate acyltransferase, partial [Hellea sp.]|nr:glycerol-3-phosphate acyltransferase [Hellea sp.]